MIKRIGMLICASVNCVSCSEQSNSFSRPITIKSATSTELQADSSLALASLPTGSKVLAICGPSSGRAFYTQESEAGWIEDGISDGRLVYVVDPQGQPDVMFKDATGSFLGVRGDSGVVAFSSGGPAARDFGVIVSYASTGVVETHSLTTSNDGSRQVLWTSLKPRVPVTKVAAFKADCF